MTIDINGLSTKIEVLTSIKENIQDGDTDTAIDMVNQMIELEIDRPFLFSLFDRETGEILFIGRVADPAKG